MICILLYLIFAGILFFILDFLGKKYLLTENQKNIFKIIYLIVLAGFFSYFGIAVVNKNIFLIVVFEFVFRMIYILYFLGEDFFKKEDHRLNSFFITLFISIIVNQYFINELNSVFLTAGELKIIVWLFIFISIYKFVNKSDISVSEVKKKFISTRSIAMSYTKLKLEYSEDIMIKDKKLLLVLYSIMIYENYYRPSFLRRIDDLVFKFNGKKRKLGIMQVMSKKYISDLDSIEIVIKKLEKFKDKYKNLENNYEKVIEAYTKDNFLEVKYIYDELEKFIIL